MALNWVFNMWVESASIDPIVWDNLVRRYEEDEISPAWTDFDVWMLGQMKVTI